MFTLLTRNGFRYIHAEYYVYQTNLYYDLIACLWQDHFGSSQHTSKKLLRFILYKLTSLVPFEPAYCLKVQYVLAITPPYLQTQTPPSSLSTYFCFISGIQAHMRGLPRLSVAQTAVSEYTTLAKARLDELKVILSLLA